MTQLQRCEPLASVDGEGVDGEGVADSLSIRHTRYGYLLHYRYIGRNVLSVSPYRVQIHVTSIGLHK